MKKLRYLIVIAGMLLWAVGFMSCSMSNPTLDDRVVAIQELYPEAVVYVGSYTSTPVMIKDTSGIEDVFLIPSYTWRSDVKPRELTRIRELK